MHWSEYLTRAIAAAHSTGPKSLYALAHNIHAAWQRGATVYTCGNGGSAANATHLAQDLSKGTIIADASRLRCICLCDSLPSLTAWANDEGYEHVFAEQLRSLGQQGDLLIAISGSGNSANVLDAVHMAHELEMRTWGIVGFDGGQLLGLAHRCVHVPCRDMGTVEAVHSLLFHWLTAYLRAAFDDSLQGRLSALEAWVPPQ